MKLNFQSIEKIKYWTSQKREQGKKKKKEKKASQKVWFV